MDLGLRDGKLKSHILEYLKIANVFEFSANLILRPCDQYPSEPGVLKSRPLSSLSAHSSHGGGSSAQNAYGSGTHNTISSHDEEGYDSENGIFVKPSKTTSRQLHSKMANSSSSASGMKSNKVRKNESIYPNILKKYRFYVVRRCVKHKVCQT